MRAVQIGVVGVMCAFLTQVNADPVQRLLEATGAERVRVVWTRSANNVFGFQNGWLDNEVLIGFDTHTGVEDTIMSEVSNYQRPLINRTGCYVLYSNRTDTSVHMVDFEGVNPPVKIAHGVAGCLWYDSAADKEYAYYSDAFEGPSQVAVRRVNIMEPSEDNLVFNEAESLPVNGQWLCVSSDAVQLGCVFGWPACRTYIVDENRMRISSNGCWTSMPYDTTYRLVHLNVDHTGIIVAERPGGTTIKTEVLTGTINHGRLASYSVRFLMASQGMNEEGGTEGGFISLMKMDSALTTVEDTVIVTERLTMGGDGYPDMWCGPSSMDCGVVGSGDGDMPLPTRTGTRIARGRVLSAHTLDGRRVEVPVGLSLPDARTRMNCQGSLIITLSGGERVLLTTQ